MSRRVVNTFILITFVVALAIIALQLTVSSISVPDPRGVGGNWKPYKFDTDSTIDNRYLITDGGIFTIHSELDNQTLIVYAENENQLIYLDPPPDGWFTYLPTSSLMPQEPYILNLSVMD